MQINFQDRLQLYQDFYLNLFNEFRYPIDFLSSMPGNYGDHLIWSGCINLFNLINLNFNQLSYEELLASRQNKNRILVIPGSGAMTLRWHEWLPKLIIRMSKIYKKVIIMPSEYEVHVDVVFKALTLSNVYPMARDAISYNQIKKISKAIIAPDPALWALKFLSHKKIVSDAKKTLIAFRNDVGSELIKNKFIISKSNNDISLSVNSLENFIATINKYNQIVTDRLHVLVASIMLGKKVFYIDPANEKITRYIQFQFRDYFKDQVFLITTQWLIKNKFIYKGSKK